MVGIPDDSSNYVLHISNRISLNAVRWNPENQDEVCCIFILYEVRHYSLFLFLTKIGIFMSSFGIFYCWTYLLQIACTSSQSDKVFLFDIGYVSSAPTEVSPLTLFFTSTSQFYSRILLKHACCWFTIKSYIIVSLFFLFLNYQTECCLLLFSLNFFHYFFYQYGSCMMYKKHLTKIVLWIWIRDKVDLLPSVCTIIEIHPCKGFKQYLEVPF